jgi:Ca2+/H+ antiporter, TMEM165/GDT1 family
VGVMLSTFGTFWAGEGLGVAWPGSDLAIIPLLGMYLLFSWLAVRSLAAANSTRALAAA